MGLSHRILSPRSALLILVAACNLYLVHVVLMMFIISDPHTTTEHALLWGSGLAGLALLALGGGVAWESLRHLRNAEAALEESLAELQLYASETPALLWTTDQSLRLRRLQGNRPITNMDERAPAPHLGASMAEYFGLPDDASMLEAQRQALGGHSTSCAMEWHGRRWEGRVEPMRASDGEVVGAATVALDVTEQRRAEQELRETRDQLHALIDASPLAIVVSGVDGRLEVWNAAATRMFGWEEADVLGHPDPTIVDVALAQYRAVRERVLAGGSVTDVETVRVGEAGELEVSVSAAPVRDPDGAIRGVMWVIADISKRKGAEEERDRLQMQLQHAIRLEAVGRLAGGVAHDFNNLLTAIKGHSNLLLEDAPEGPSREELGEIVHAADRAAELTRQLLTFSRQQITEPRRLNLNDVVNDMRRMLVRVIGEDVALDTVLDPELGWVLADVGQIEQVLMNLSVNARDAMPSGGELVITTENVEISEAEAERYPYEVKPGDYVLLSVADTGLGMGDETLASIFEPFFTTKPPGVGTGLGLSTVYGIVKQSNGYIWVDSEPAAGSVFRIYLPRVPAPARDETEIAQDATRVGHGHRGTILVVEDEGAVRALMRRVLEREGYAVIEAPTGVAALRILEDGDRELELVITDLSLPAMTGGDVAKAVRRLRPGLTVLYTSGSPEANVMADDTTAGTIAFLEKPFAPDDLVRKVKATLVPSG